MTTSDRQPPEMPDAQDTTAEIDAATTDRSAALLERALFEVKRVIVGQDAMVERLLVGLLARGHCCSRACRASPRRWRCEPWPTSSAAASPGSSSPPTWCPPTSSAPGSSGPSTETFDVELGPVFANLVLADEINRAPAKVQSALLEAMAERQVSIGGRTYPVPDPFLVLATQNPIESEGVYQLPGGAARPVPDEGRRRLPDRRRGAGASCTG